jgi:hypothetical protein
MVNLGKQPMNRSLFPMYAEKYVFQIIAPSESMSNAFVSKCKFIVFITNFLITIMHVYLNHVEGFFNLDGNIQEAITKK